MCAGRATTRSASPHRKPMPAPVTPPHSCCPISGPHVPVCGPIKQQECTKSGKGENGGTGLPGVLGSQLLPPSPLAGCLQQQKQQQHCLPEKHKAKQKRPISNHKKGPLIPRVSGAAKRAKKSESGAGNNERSSEKEEAHCGGPRTRRRVLWRYLSSISI